jgi:hypothetical protein
MAVKSAAQLRHRNPKSGQGLVHVGQPQSELCDGRDRNGGDCDAKAASNRTDIALPLR